MLKQQLFIFTLALISIPDSSNCLVLVDRERFASKFQSDQRRDFTCPEEDGFFAIPGECSSDYYACISNEPFLLQCPGNEIFDPADLTCVAPDNASCSATTSTIIESTTTTAGPDCLDGDGFYPIPDTCGNDYYICFDGDAYLQHCPPGSVFDPLLLKCVTPDIASCSTKSSTTAVSSPITESSSPSSVSEGTTTTILTESTTSPSISTTQSTICGDYTCPSPNGLFPDPCDCAKFYQCANDVAYPNTCPPGLVFNPIKGQCDYPINVPGC